MTSDQLPRRTETLSEAIWRRHSFELRLMAWIASCIAIFMLFLFAVKGSLIAASILAILLVAGISERVTAAWRDRQPIE